MIELPRYQLQPGELIMVRSACRITTLLGSCVAVSLFCKRLQAAAMCHVTLPGPDRAGSSCDWPEERFRYASFAIPEMADFFWGLGACPAEVEARIFGGSQLLGLIEGERAVYAVGRRNVERVRSLLTEQRLAILEESVGLIRCRSIQFDTWDGEVRCHSVSMEMEPKAKWRRRAAQPEAVAR